MADPVLSVQNIWKSFGALQVSKAVTLDLRAGEIHALIGPNGAGKSTLIKQIAGGLLPDQGRVILNGKDVTEMNTAERARLGLGRTFQVSTLAMDDSVLQNVLLGALGAAGNPYRLFGSALRNPLLRETAERALSRVGLEDCSAQRTSELSHGQRRQLEVAIAMTLAPKAFVMDEPMAGLGTEGSKRLTAFLDGLRAEAPILLVEHDMDAVFSLADRISVLVYGEIVATGTVDEIRKDPDVRRAYLGDDE